jgi:hypothetical protein
MKLYIVTADEYEQDDGAEIYCLGIYDSEPLAMRRKNNCKYKNVFIDEIQMNSDCDVYLGGHAE